MCQTQRLIIQERVVKLGFKKSIYLEPVSDNFHQIVIYYMWHGGGD